MNAHANVPATIEQPNAKNAPLVSGARPRAIVPTDMDQVWRFATIVAKSGLAPKDMQKAETITVAIMHGLEVGLTPLMALQRIAVINGRPSIWGDGAMGLVRASGLCEFVYEAIAGDGDKMVAVCRVKRKGEKEQIERTFSVDDAKRAGLWGKSGTWQLYPKRMLQMRARAFALRDLFADVLGGLYIAEELEGVDDDRPLKDVTPRPVVMPGNGAELPAELPAPTRQEPEVAKEVAAEPAGKRQLPPLTKGGKAPAAEKDDIPVFLRRQPPPADQPEAFREWIVHRVSTASSVDDLQTIWDTHIADNDKIMPPDLEDLSAVITGKREELEAL